MKKRPRRTLWSYQDWDDPKQGHSISHFTNGKFGNIHVRKSASFERPSKEKYPSEAWIAFSEGIQIFPNYSGKLLLVPHNISLQDVALESRVSQGSRKCERRASPMGLGLTVVGWESMVIKSVTGGFSSLMVRNAVDQWQLKLMFTTIGHLVIPICFIIDHLRDTVRTFARHG